MIKNVSIIKKNKNVVSFVEQNHYNKLQVKKVVILLVLIVYIKITNVFLKV